MGYMGILLYSTQKAIFYLLKGDYSTHRWFVAWSDGVEKKIAATIMGYLS